MNETYIEFSYRKPLAFQIETEVIHARNRKLSEGWVKLPDIPENRKRYPDVIARFRIPMIRRLIPKL